MERRLKERITGAAILVMLAVIFIPMLLDDTVREDSRITESNIPARPGGRFETRMVPLDPPRKSPAPPRTEPAPDAGGGGPAREAATARKASAPQPDKAGETAEETAPAPVPEGETSSPETTADTAAKTTPSAPEPRPQPEQTAAAEPAPAPAADPAAAPAEAPRGLPAWVVQLGSFSSRDNADRLTRSLQEDGYPAFMESAQQGGRPVYRVRVGPELQRSEAEALRDRLSREVELDGMVMQYP